MKNLKIYEKSGKSQGTLKWKMTDNHGNTAASVLTVSFSPANCTLHIVCHAC